MYILSFIEIYLVLLDVWSWKVNTKPTKGDNLKIINYNVMVLVYCTPSYYYLITFQVSILSTLGVLVKTRKGNYLKFKKRDNLKIIHVRVIVLV